VSYHNGSIWPHDTAICAAGISNYGGCAQVVQILGEIFEAAHHVGMRLAELYCGFPRTEGQGAAPYPVACLPQAWSAGGALVTQTVLPSTNSRATAAQNQIALGGCRYWWCCSQVPFDAIRSAMDSKAERARLRSGGMHPRVR
jgi:glycogen debranching enzyme